mgnify:CR=1 FL=1
MNKLLAWLVKFGASNIGKLLIKIGTSALAKILEDVFKIVKSSINKTDEIYTTVVQNETLTYEEIKQIVLSTNSFEITERQYKYFLNNDDIKGMFKYVVAMDIIKAKLKEEKKEVSDFILNLCIEIVISGLK